MVGGEILLDKASIRRQLWPLFQNRVQGAERGWVCIKTLKQNDRLGLARLD